MVLKACAIIPVYNHAQTLGPVLAALAGAGLDCIVIDDGSDRVNAALMDEFAASPPVVALIRLVRNAGKGAAVQAGIREAVARDYTHALQVDADGQHDLAAVPRFLAETRAYPAAVICGEPEFGADAPALRFFARYLTHVWVWINTLSLDIRDSMCGFRVYPLGPVLRLMNRRRLGSRMSFDTEILVHLHWLGEELRWLPVRVVYRQDSRSQFRPLDDNVRISLMHTRLFFGMLWRAPALLWRRLRHLA